MFPPSFDYHRADSVAEALSLLATHADRDARVVAGGHGLLPAMKAGEASPGVLVDVSGVPGLGSVEADGDGVAVGALATHADLAGSELLGERAPALADAARNVGDLQVRNRGTVGGNLVQADPAADLPPAVVAAGATVRVRHSDGERTVPAGDFFAGDGETDLEDGELVVGVRVPRGGGGAYVRKTHPATGYALVGVAAVVEVAGGEVAEDGGSGATGGEATGGEATGGVDGAEATAGGTTGGEVVDARVAAGGATDRPVRLRAVEDALTGAPADDEAVAAAASRAAADLDPDRLVSDAHAGGKYRAALLEPYAGEALGTALSRARGSDASVSGGGAG